MNDQPEPMDFNAIVGRNVAAARKARGWSQGDLAARLSRRGLSFQQQTVLKVEKGSRPLRLEEAAILAELLGFDVNNLIRPPKTTEEEQAVVEALLRVHEIKARVRDVNLQIEELTREKKVLGQARSEALKQYHAARKAANMPTTGRIGGDDPVIAFVEDDFGRSMSAQQEEDLDFFVPRDQQESDESQGD